MSIPEPADSRRTAPIGPYGVVRELGAGGMATVYLANDTKHHRQVAIKVLRAELAASVGAERFLREIEIAAGLQHPHILPLYDSGEADGKLFYVMPFVDGESLRDRLTKGGMLPVDEALRLVREVVDALAYSHRRGVVHRDIKPENILLSDGHALVLDFGIAKAISDANNATQLTSAGMAMGTPSYMAPEQISADPSLDHRVDIYAVGIMAYELLAGRTPFAGNNAQQILAAHLARAPEPVSTHRSAVSPAVEAIIMRCLEKTAADRWQSMSDLLNALDAAMTGGASTIANTTAGKRQSSTRSTATSATASRRWMTWLGAGALVVAMAVGGVLYVGKDGRAGTLIGNDVLAQNDVVLVSDFQNHTADSTLAATITDAVRVELQQSRVVRVMSQSAMWAGLRRMGLLPGASLPEGKVQELAEREGAKAFVVGDIARLGAGYQLTARVVATAGGTEALTAKATAANEAELISAVELLGQTIRKGIGESLRSVGSTPPLARVTTSSLEALKLYTIARRAVNSGELPRAVLLARQALALDSNFASAWSSLYVSHINMGDVPAALDAVTHAYAMQDRLSESDALTTRARYHGMRGEVSEEEDAWRQLIDMGQGHTNYANMLLERRRFADAEAMQRKGVELDPKSAVGYWNLVEAQAAQGKFAAADSSVRLATRNVPESQIALQLGTTVQLARRDYDATDAYFRTADGEKLLRARRDLQCTVDLLRGRLTQFAPCQAPAPLIVKLTWAMAGVRLTGDTTYARRAYATFFAMASDARPVDAYSRVIALLSEAGRVREAQQLMDEWRRRTKGTDPTFVEDSTFALGSIAAAEKRWDRAAELFLIWNSAPMPSSFHFYNRGLPEAAAALARAGKTDSAVVLLERALSIASTAGGTLYEAAWYSQALQMLGDAYAARGNRDKAAEYYSTYLTVMRDAEPPIGETVRAVKEKLVRLTAEPGKAKSITP